MERGPSERLTGVVIGAGDRGAKAYAPLLLAEPELGTIVGVAEHAPQRRAAFADRFDLPAEACFASARELLARPRFADFAVIATQDAEHVEAALAALDAGYHVLLEKPMAQTEEDCERLLEASERTGRLLMICHVLRFAPLYRGIHEVIASGEIGEVHAKCGAHIANIIGDGDCLQMGIGAIPDAVWGEIGDRRNLGIHTEDRKSTRLNSSH